MALPAPERARVLYESAGFSAADMGPLQLRRHTDHAKYMFQLEPTFHVLAASHLEKGSLKEIARVKQIAYGTLKDWRQHLRADPEWRPYQDRNVHRRALTADQETEVLREVEDRYINKGLYCPPKVPQLIAKRIWANSLTHAGNRPSLTATESAQADDEQEGLHELPDLRQIPVQIMSEEEFSGKWTDAETEDDSETKDDMEAYREKEAPKFTRRWRDGFLKRNRLSLRRPHMRRRPVVDEGRELAFLREMKDIFAQFPPGEIYNLDETRWCLVSSHEITIAPRGIEGVTANFRGDPKQSLTAIAVVNAAGEKMALWVICKGTTTRCERRFRRHFQRAIADDKLI
jgi:hypothetical protein